MIHFLYTCGFALIVSAVFAIIARGTTAEKIKYGLKVFAQFMIFSLVLAWILYFLPAN